MLSRNRLCLLDGTIRQNSRDHLLDMIFFQYDLYNCVSSVCSEFFDLSCRSAPKQLFTTCCSVFPRFCHVLHFHCFANLKLAFSLQKLFGNLEKQYIFMKIFISSREQVILLWALTTLISLWWVSYEGSFQVCDGRWSKKIHECQALRFGDAPMHPQKISRRLKLLSLGMPPCIPFSINNHQFVLLHAIFLSLDMLCAMLGASRSLLFSLFSFTCCS